MTTWEELSAHTITDFEPHAIQQCTGTSARQMWSELGHVARAGAVRSTSALSGQLLEVIFKQALLDLGAPANLQRKPLGQVLQEARRLGVLSSPTGSPTIASSVAVAQYLRNEASHGGPLQKDISPQRATYSLVFLICFSGYLFPRLNGIEAKMKAEPADLTEYSDEPSPLLVTPASQGTDPWAARIVVSSPRGIVKWWRAAAPSDRLHISTALTENFGSIIENIGFAQIGSVLGLAQCLQDMQLPNQARCCGILLPHDSKTIRQLSTQSPRTLGKYLYECKRADTQIFNRSADVARYDMFKRTGADLLNRPEVGLNVCFNLLATFPAKMVHEVMTEQRDVIIKRIETATPADNVSVLRALQNRRICEGDVRRDVLNAVTETVRSCELIDLSPVPLRLHQLHILDDQVSGQLRRVLLTRATSGEDLRITSRLFWDLFMFLSASTTVPHLKAYCDSLVDASQSLWQDLGSGDDAWSQLLLQSVAVVAGRTAPRYSALTFNDLNLTWPEGEADRYQQLRVGYVLRLGGMRLPDSLVVRLRDLAVSTHLSPDNTRRSPATASFLSACRSF